MAGVLDALASYIQNMLMQMAAEEVHMLLGVTDEIDNMVTKLQDLKNFLVDADRRNITEQSVHAWVAELRNAMYEATDILDLCQLKAMERGPRNDAGCLNPLLFCLRNPLHAHDIGSRILNLNKKLDGIKARGASFNFINLGSYEERGRNMVSYGSGSRETSGCLVESSLVGGKIEEDARNLVEMLTKWYPTCNDNESNKIIVFSIVGVGGIGKTTLAQKIYNNEAIKQEFQKKVWLSVNQGFDDNEMLRRVIIEAGGNHHDCGNSKVSLEHTLIEALKGQKTLLIMDDVWDSRIWEGVLRTPFVNAMLAEGSRVLVTTRNDIVAREMKAEEPYHRIDKLGHEDAWLLLKKQVVRDINDEPQVEILKDIGMRLVEKCDGLPLGVKVMGGLLRQRRIRRSYWQNVLDDSLWSISQMPKELNYAIYLSYEDLRPCLKPCFLHYSLLPRSKLFFVSDIVAMWISEGFVHGTSRDLEEIGREYYDELIHRNLIEPHMFFVDQALCNMHDVVQSFAHNMFGDEAFIAYCSKIVIDKLQSQKYIRLSLESRGSEQPDLEWCSLQTQTSLRTLILVGNIKIQPGDSFRSLSSLRTLHLDSVNIDAIAESLHLLQHLRYMSIENSNTSKLPEDIGKLKFLQYISLYGCQRLSKLPSSIGMLQDLRYLGIAGTDISVIPRDFCGLTCLRQLYGFQAHMDCDDHCSLEELGPLSQLTGIGIRFLENVASSSSVIKARLAEKNRLRFLSLHCTSRLPCLEFLQIHRARAIKRVGHGFLQPNNLVGVSFPRLQELYFVGMVQWEEWVWEGQVKAMQILERLKLEVCKLSYLPPGLALHARALKDLLIHDVKHLNYLENFTSVVYLEVFGNIDLERISNLPKLQKLAIVKCPKLKVLEGMPALQRLNLEDCNKETVPRYLQDVNPRHLELACCLSLLTCIAEGKSGPEWHKFSLIKHVKTYAGKWYVLYTRDPFCFETNISLSAIAHARIRRIWLPYSETPKHVPLKTSGLHDVPRTQTNACPSAYV